MSPEEASEAATNGTLTVVEGVDPASAIELDGDFCVGELVVLRVGEISPFLSSGGDLALTDENGVVHGTLCFTRRIVQANADSLTRWQYAAYLAEVTPDQLGQNYDFLGNYLVLDAEFVPKYKADYMDGAPIWGGFTHDFTSPRLSGPVKTAIVGLPGILLPTTHHRQSLNRYVEATNAFDRFLKLYHALELLFDFAVMKQMQSMGDDLLGFGRIISSYNSNELKRLKHVITAFCDEPERVAQNIALVTPHVARAKEIFQDHGKEGNPLKDEGGWIKFCQTAAASQLAESDVNNMKGVSNTNNYREFVSTVAAYWIYRVRSSIAHNRVGEFLFLETDEAFVAEFAEPLLLEVVRQVLSGAELKKIVT